MAPVEITMLNSMAHREFADSVRQHRAWGLKVMDLKDCLFGKNLLDLTDAQATIAAALITEHDLSVYCFSTGLFYDDMEMGEAAFRATLSGKVARTIALAKILRPKIIRLLAARTSKRNQITEAMGYIQAKHPWLIPLYRQAIDQLADAGLPVTIENECHDCLLAKPAEVRFFFQALERPQVSFTWDVQNFWQMGTFPSLSVYHELRDLVGYYHVKGGQCVTPSDRLEYRSALEDASWPVAEITQAVIAGGRSPVICINPPHGQAKAGVDYSNVTLRDLNYLKRLVAGG